MGEEKEAKVILSEMTDEQLRQTVKVKLVKFVCICGDYPDSMRAGQAEALPRIVELILEMTG